MTSIAENIAKTLIRITQAEQKFGREAGSVNLLAVSKTKPSQDVRCAYAEGLTNFGENYLQDALPKIEQLADLNIIWHFIGPIQSNKSRAVAESFHWVHSVDRLKIARRLNEQRPEHLPPLNICIQVNISEEDSKSGVAPAELPAIVAEVQQLPRLCVRGLMAIPAAGQTLEVQHQTFAKMHRLFAGMQALAPAMDTLSMGMSQDLEVAVAEGSTMVRVGTDIFGVRPVRKVG